MAIVWTKDLNTGIDVIDHQHNGYLATPYETADLARGIAWVLEDRQRWDELSGSARNTICGSFALDTIAARHMALYREVSGHA